MTKSLSLPAFAKINLGLRVGSRRADGYHEIGTIFQTISLHDTIEMNATEDPHIVLACDDRSLSTSDDNLVMRAVKSLQERFAPQQGVRIRLQKRIPMQAGLGGGSSDAATTLMGLARLWDLPASRHELAAIGKELGADVTFFLFGGTAHASGVGDRVEVYNDAPKKFLLIVKPNANISTAEAYRALDQRFLTSPNSNPILSTSQPAADSDEINLANLTNDFEAVVFDLEPEIRRAKSALLKAGASAALLAGSGSAMVGIFASEDAQRRAIQAIELETGWRVFPCKMVGRQEYQSAFGDLAPG